jgi:hypothetical protein
MHRRYSHRIVAIVSRAILLGSTLVVGFWAITSTAVWGFGPPSNVVADVSPDLPSAVPRKVFGHVVYCWVCKHHCMYARSRRTSGPL